MKELHLKTTSPATQRRIMSRREFVRELLDLYPQISTDDIAERLGWDRATIRRDRKVLGLTLIRPSVNTTRRGDPE